LQNQLSKKIEEYFHQLPSLAEPWIKMETRRRIENNSELAQELGSERLGELKRKMNSLINQLPEICDKIKQNRIDLPHRKEKDRGKIPRRESYFASCFRDTISHLGSLLNAFGLIEEKNGNFPSWKEHNGEFVYQLSPSFDGGAIKPVNEYNEILKKYENILSVLEIKRKELEKTRAGELWDSV